MISRNIKRSALVTFIFLLILAITFFLIQKRGKELMADRIALVDTLGENYVFRGNNPFITKNGKKVFAHNQLTSYFNDILEANNHKPLTDYYLIDISLLDLDMYFFIQDEKEFFAKNPNKGKIINASTLSPSLLLSEHSIYSSFLAKPVIDHYNSWATTFIKEIHKIASQKRDKPVVLYIHCDAGRDRTGLIVAGYRMLFNDMNLSEVRAQNISDVGRNSRNLYDKAIYAYCLHAQKLLKKPSNYCASNG